MFRNFMVVQENRDQQAKPDDFDGDSATISRLCDRKVLHIGNASCRCRAAPTS